MVGELKDTVRLRPDDQALAFGIHIEDGVSGIRLFHLDPPKLGQRVSDSHTTSSHPTWAPDGKSLSYMWGLKVHSIEIGGVANDEAMFNKEEERKGADFPTCWHPQEDVLLYTDEDVTSHWDIRLFDKKTGGISDFVNTESVETGAVFSPDGKWVAYQSNDGGRFEIFIKPYPLEAGFPNGYRPMVESSRCGPVASTRSDSAIALVRR